MDFIIDAEIVSLLPPHTKDEADTLDRLVDAGEHVDDLVVLDVAGVKILGDGHHRLKLCEAKGIKYRTRVVKVASREEAIQWVIDNQIGRRNLSDERRAYYRGKEYLSRKKSHGDASRTKNEENPMISPSAQNAHLGNDTAKEVAGKHGVNPSTVRRDAEYAKAVDTLQPDEKEEVLSGKSGKSKAEVINPVLCERCARVGVTKDCEKCVEARKAAKEEKKAAKAKKKEREPGEDDKAAKDKDRDEEGHKVPEAVAPAFANLEKFLELDSLLRQVQKLLDELSRLPGGEQLVGWLKPTGNAEKTINKSEHVNTLKRELKGVRPHSVCPWCKGTCKPGCKGCHGNGWVTAITWTSAEDEVKARLSP